MAVGSRSISSHTLTTRPVVDSADKVYTIAIQRPSPGTMLIVDGQEQIPMGVGCCVTVRRAPVSFGLVKVPSRSYYQTLRDKLRWGTPPNYRSEPCARRQRKARNGNVTRQLRVQGPPMNVCKRVYYSGRVQ